MAAPTPTQLREALRQNLADVFEQEAQVSSRMLVSPSPPTMEISRGRTVFDQAMGHGLHHWNFNVQVMVGLVSDAGSSERLDTLCDENAEKSVKRAIEKPDGPNGVEVTLGGLASSVQVTEMSEERIYELDNGRRVIGCDFTVVVKAPGK